MANLFVQKSICYSAMLYYDYIIWNNYIILTNEYNFEINLYVGLNRLPDIVYNVIVHFTINEISIAVISFEGELHPKLKLIMFHALSLNYQHFLGKII